ncbi:bifunctional demethylmenaquinone methyltransferase/2-methoxy-6-polyprenyl-1,4-benzoquinol methylase UbiE [Calditerrivibrio nitroreducens]|uniref:Demethylmenaquinone methyltransferase n=1 Tax=Calditerrivibrio nitroreducens (strain DSM 19672 / NBRC 101217 / Yu37-1) TaxID=768670 RepID=E4TG90_CALNY|nr:bifunctional demethylmenaquinone methyltransferase/2-methoxy-6-polyprenyl-1,4-benzoquinol methylase UbiE [Calditerrivibrio nitroreducens]ADR19677.1 ubiquinone/menaquinone biosynthesis methyltransferase [Calditerrivibrio nitroreducens DSM 19672]
MEEKSKQIQKMFNNIAPKYDLLNRLLSFRRDVYWRKKSINLLNISDGMTILDLACGTGDMIIQLRKKIKDVNIIGADFSKNMLDIARQKGVMNPLINADAHYLPFKDGSFDRIMIAFGFRNVVNKEIGLKELFRVLKPGGILCILEFSQPEGKIFSKIYRFYFQKVLPFIGGLISGNRNAYSYLPDSVYKFPKKDDYKKMILNAGFEKADFNFMTFGICNAAICYKKY